MGRGENEPIEVKCPKCKLTKIVYIPRQEIPSCPACNIPMNISELLDEGKSC